VRLPCATHLISAGNSKERLESEVRPLVKQFLRERGLKLSPDKTRITHIDEGFDFLRQYLRKYDGKALVKSSKENTQAFLEKVRGIIGGNGTVSQTLLIDLLNPVMRGWANLPSVCGGEGDVRPGGSRNLAAPLAMGQTQTSQEIGGLREEAILTSPGRSKLGVCVKDGGAHCGRQAGLETSCFGKRLQFRRHFKIYRVTTSIAFAAGGEGCGSRVHQLKPPEA
jgi:hypothetical protein